MRLRLFRGRLWQPARSLGTHRRSAGADQPPRSRTGPRGVSPGGRPPEAPRGVSPGGRPPEAPRGVSPAGRTVDTPRFATTARNRASVAAAGGGRPSSQAIARAAIRTAPATATAGAAAPTAAAARTKATAPVSESQPWYAISRAAPGLRHCGCLEDVLVREWAIGADPGPQAVAAINRLAELPLLVKQKLAAGLDAIYVGAGGVPDLDDMGSLAGVPLPSGRATWDACAGAYGDRKIIIGSRPSPTPDVTCHEVGHALDELDGAAGQWQSDTAAFHALYRRCLPHLATGCHRRSGSLGRREFFADAFAAIASGQRPALVEMLSGDTRSALDVMLYFNVRYGI
jgi:hypothetical protein